MNTVQQEVDERSNLTGSNKFELLLFRLGGDHKGEHSELFGINVFEGKTRSVGADAYVAKFSSEDLASAIRAVVGTPGPDPEPTARQGPVRCPRSGRPCLRGRC